MDKEKEIKRELNKLRKIFKDIPEDKKQLVEGLIDNAAFMAVTLKELQQEVTANGAVVTCVSGNGFETLKDNPAQKAYTAMMSKYSAVIAQLMGLLPSNKAVEISKAGDALRAFIQGGKPE